METHLDEAFRELGTTFPRERRAAPKGSTVEPMKAQGKSDSVRTHHDGAGLPAFAGGHFGYSVVCSGSDGGA